MFLKGSVITGTLVMVHRRISFLEIKLFQKKRREEKNLVIDFYTLVMDLFKKLLLLVQVLEENGVLKH